jgi:molybdenum cofactor synthesis domain-containing protein
MRKCIKVDSVNISERKGIVKKPVESIRLTSTGVADDAHRGPWHRQVSMLGVESIEKFSKDSARQYAFGDFAENITSNGMEVFKSGVFDYFSNDEVALEVTQIGKKCHGAGCSIYKEVGNCVMPKEGIFLRVKKEGSLKRGDFLNFVPRIFKVKIITLSDRASQGFYEDRSGPRINQLSCEFFEKNNRKHDIENVIIPDDGSALTREIQKGLDRKVDIIFTTGGTGIGPRDITPDVIKPMLDKEIPGIMELIRVKYGMEKPNGLLSRSVAGVIDKSLVYTMPGSPRAIQEYTHEIFKTVMHSMQMLHDINAH